MRSFKLLLLFLTVVTPWTAHSALPAKPNIVFILADDLGWTDLTCMGSAFYETPHIY